MDPILLLFFVFPIVIYTAIVIQSPKLNIYSIFILVFSFGLIDYFFSIRQLLSLFIEIYVVILLAQTIVLTNKNNVKFKMPMILPFVVFSMIFGFSSIINETSLYQDMIFYRYFIVQYLFFLALVNYNFPIKSVNKLVGLLFIIQIFAAIIKLMTIGIQETMVGTIDYKSGAAATIFPLMAIGILLANYISKYKDNLLYNIALFIGFSLIAFMSGKRAFWMYMPIVLLFSFVLHTFGVKGKKSKKIKYLFFTVIISLLTFYLGVRLIPTFNPENTYWGSFNFNFFLNYFNSYNNRLIEGYMTFGRLDTTIHSFNLIFSNSLTTIFGYGPDALAIQGNEAIGSVFDIRYGLTGLSYSLLTVGLAGLISYIYIYLKFACVAFTKLRKTTNKSNKRYYYIALILIFVFFIDFFTYSTTSIFNYSIRFILFYYLAMLYKKGEKENVYG